MRIPAGAWFTAIILTTLFVIASYFWTRPGYRHGMSSGYVGPAACTDECHQLQGESWSETRMAQSFEALRPGTYAAVKTMAGLDPEADYTEVDSCLYCHTTGYGLVGGFVSFEETPDLAGVTCEACHGPGGMYVNTVMDARDPMFETTVAREAGLIYPPTARVCRKCHNEDSPFINVDYEFNYTERVAKGTHQHYPLKYEHGD